ncbi:uncharacterized protein METZ01_LOCUS175534 [marine metagenome]|uniref:Uncharacterized protein n=1 Tax=marine metagenome TaxID=408172 RepID=A0A382C9E6_9ZZZZ
MYNHKISESIKNAAVVASGSFSYQIPLFVVSRPHSY